MRMTRPRWRHVSLERRVSTTAGKKQKIILVILIVTIETNFSIIIIDCLWFQLRSESVSPPVSCWVVLTILCLHHPRADLEMLSLIPSQRVSAPRICAMNYHQGKLRSLGRDQWVSQRQQWCSKWYQQRSRLQWWSRECCVISVDLCSPVTRATQTVMSLMRLIHHSEDTVTRMKCVSCILGRNPGEPANHHH